MNKPSNLSKDIQNVGEMTLSEWDYAIVVAQKEIRTLDLKVRRLKHAVRVFQKNKKEGFPWPGKDGQAEENKDESKIYLDTCCKF